MTAPMTSRKELLACPFCGHKVALSILEDAPGETISAWVHCSCGVELHESRTEEEAAQRWNTRAGLAQAPAEPELLKIAKPLFDAVTRFNQCLADYGWSPRRSHIEIARNTMEQVAAALGRLASITSTDGGKEKP